MAARVSQAGTIVFRTEAGRTTVLLVRSKKDPAIWVFPKGHVDGDETEQDAAIRETLVTTRCRGPMGAGTRA